jgi:HemK-like putative methylase
MPRRSPGLNGLLKRLSKIHTPCDAQRLAKSELRWLWKHAKQQYPHSTAYLHLQHMLRERTLERKPLQYILGTQPFLSLDIRTRPPTLIPRPETEAWTAQLVDLLKPRISPDRPFHILDLCTGTGCIALGLASELSNCVIIGVDKSKEAIQLAQENTRLHKTQLDHNHIHFLQADLYASDLPEQLIRLLQHYSPNYKKFDFIVSNPPYVCPNEYDQLDPEIRNWEDRDALVPTHATDLTDPNAIGIYERIVELIPQLLLPSHHIQFAVEIGNLKQFEFIQSRFNQSTLWYDQYQQPRVVLGSFALNKR